MIRITIEIDELEETPGREDEAQWTVLIDTFNLVAQQILDGETRGYVEDGDGAPCASFRVDEGLSVNDERTSAINPCRCGARESDPIHTSGYVTGLSGHAYVAAS